MLVEGIWTGRIIYSSLNAHALIADVSHYSIVISTDIPAELQEEADTAVQSPQGTFT
jgi:hypothetical protein